MKILIVNDDGIDSGALKKLVKLVDKDFGYCYVSVPSVQKSATSNAITINPTIKYEEINPIEGSERTILVDGFPADCVRVANNLFDTEFDLVISGVNKGENLSYDVIYSGTIAAAREASVYGLNSIAISAPSYIENDFDKNIAEVLHYIIDNKLYEDADLLNVNVANNSKGIKWTSQGKRIYHPILTPKTNSFEILYSLNLPKEEETKDQVAYSNGYTTITPLKIDQTDHDFLKKIKKTKK